MLKNALSWRHILVLAAVYFVLLLADPLKTTTVIQCDNGWIQRGNSCYLWIQDILLDYDTARQECYIHDSDMLIVTDNDIQSWVNTQSLKYSTDGWWIGSKKDPKSQIWKWVYSHGVSLNWASEPDNFQNQDCVATNSYGRYFDESCNNKLPYICKFKKPDRAQCPGNPPKAVRWYQNINTCYYVSDPLDQSQYLTWTYAKSACANLSGYGDGQLLSMTSFQELAFLYQTLPKNTANTLLLWWTGLNDRLTEGTYVWQDGTAPTLSIPWDSSPNNRSGENQNCAIMYSGGVVDDAKCTSRAYVICAKTAVNSKYDLGCGKWTRAGHSCYLFASSGGFTWSEAKAKCQLASADLVKVDNKDEMHWINNMDIGDGGFWTGLRTTSTIGTTRKWQWTDGTSLDTNFVRWNQEPNNYAENEDCAVIYNDGVYNDMKCDAEEGYICTYEKNDGNDCLPGFRNMVYSYHCYYISSTNQSELLTWYDVAQKCSDLVQSDGALTGQMFGVSGDFEKEWIEDQLQHLPETPFGWWTALNDRTFEGVWMYSTNNKIPDPRLMKYDKTIIRQTMLMVKGPYTTDATKPGLTTPLDLVCPAPVQSRDNTTIVLIYTLPWNQEPNNKGGNESCATMYSGGRFNDLNCYAKQYFICERPVAGYSISSSHSWIIRGTSQRCSFTVFSVLLCIFVQLISYAS